MRQVKTFEDVQIVLRELLDWKTRVSTKDWDFHQLRIKNASPGVDQNDYVTLSQLQNAVPAAVPSNKTYTQVFSSSGTVLTGDMIPGFVVGLGRGGIPNQVWIAARVAASSSDLQVNISIDGNLLLLNPITLPIGQTAKVFSSTFVSPTPKLAIGATVFPEIIQGDGIVSIVSVGLVVNLVDQG